MKRTSPAAGIAAHAATIPVSIERCVGGMGTFLPVIEQNNPQIFAQVEKIKFT
jgi:hypothetical protein